MIAKIKSCALAGVEGYIIDVEVDTSSGLPAFDLVGLPDSAVKESKERVRSAIKNSGYEFPIKRITVNLAPADIRKEGPAFDLPIAIGILYASNLIKQDQINNTLIIGELSLDGSIRPVNGVLPMIYSAFNYEYKNFIVPYENAEEAALIEGANILPVKNLKEVVNHFCGKQKRCV